ncbi:unnamed protein product [Cuscuta epithymum]|uniref:F-box domain-containing protein n=1 Tax=Cuscuta epithymum TaxID=186058 RepID=A0AAV0FMA7_9ASTE|nr:unnamed protein product [Cuscuta epithymum]
MAAVSCQFTVDLRRPGPSALCEMALPPCMIGSQDEQGFLSRRSIFARVSMSRMTNSLYSVAHNEDFISELPDDILASILSRTPTYIALRTSILSKRWKNLYKYVSNVTLSCEDLLRGTHHGPHSQTAVYKLQRYFDNFHYGSSRIRFVSLRCCIKKPCGHQFEQLIYSLGNLGIEELHLWLSCNVPSDFAFSCEYISQIPSVTFLVLGSCLLVAGFSEKFSARLDRMLEGVGNGSVSNHKLQTLELRGVTLLPGSLEFVLSTCLRLRSLYIGKCETPSKLCIGWADTDLQLKSLVVEYCRGVEEIEIYAANLQTLEFQGNKMVYIRFDQAPLLQSLYLSIESENMMAHVFGRLAKDVSSLKSLTFDCKGDFYQESQRLMRMGGIEKFSKLRRLELNVNCMPKTDLLALTPFLQSCPLLQEFHLNVYDPTYDCGEAKEMEPAMDKLPHRYYHLNLKKVDICGFDGTENEIEFLLYILKSAVILEQMLISSSAKSYRGYGRWWELKRSWSGETFEVIQSRLQDEAVSSIAQLIFENNVI